MATAARLWALAFVLSALTLPALALSPADGPEATLPVAPVTGSVLTFSESSSLVADAPLTAPTESAIPEPASTGLLFLGLAAVASRIRRRSARTRV